MCGCPSPLPVFLLTSLPAASSVSMRWGFRVSEMGAGGGGGVWSQRGRGWRECGRSQGRGGGGGSSWSKKVLSAALRLEGGGDLREGGRGGESTCNLREMGFGVVREHVWFTDASVVQHDTIWVSCVVCACPCVIFLIFKTHLKLQAVLSVGAWSLASAAHAICVCVCKLIFLRCISCACMSLWVGVNWFLERHICYMCID